MPGKKGNGTTDSWVKVSDKDDNSTLGRYINVGFLVIKMEMVQ